MSLTIEDARDLCAAAATNNFWMHGAILQNSPYSGGVGDFAALAAYVKAKIIAIYDVDESEFDYNPPSIGLALVLRDFYHRAIKQAVTATSSWAGTTVTITNASPGVVTWPSHGLTAGQMIAFSSSGTLPTGIQAGKRYYVIAADMTTDTFKFSATSGGVALVTTGSQSGTHKCWAVTHRQESEVYADGGYLANFNADIGFCLRNGSTGLCATVAWSYYMAAHAFGWTCRRISGISGPQFTGYPGSHVFVEVLCADYGYVVLDSYFNQTPVYPDGGDTLFTMPYTGFRDAINISGLAGVEFDTFKVYTNYALNGSATTDMIQSDKDFFVSADGTSPGIIAIPYEIDDDTVAFAPAAAGVTLWFAKIFPNANTAYQPTLEQGRVFADQATAVDYIFNKRHTNGLNWVAIADDLRDEGYYVSGLSERTDLQRHFISVRLADWSYITVNIDTGEVYPKAIQEAWAVDKRFNSLSHIMGWDGTIYTGLAQAYESEAPGSILPPADLREFEKLGAEIWRDRAIASLPSSDPWKPPKNDIRKWASTVEGAVGYLMGEAADSAGLVRAWCLADVSGNILSSYNVASVTDTGTGDWTVNWGVVFVADKCSVITSAYTGSAGLSANPWDQTTTTTRVLCWNNSGVKTDPVRFSALATGELAA